MAAQIELQGIERVFHLGDSVVHALAGVDLRIEPGEYISVMGPSGSGKSTLLNVLGLLDRPDAGHYLLEGRDVTTLSADEQARVRSRRIGFVFQSFHLVPRLTAAENIALPMVLAGLPARERDARVRQALDGFGLAERAEHRPDQLSGGQRQRVLIARAMIPRPEIVIADEAVSALDVSIKAGILRLMEDLRASQGVGYLLISHDLPVVRKVARHVYVMRNGQVVEEGPTAEVFDTPRHDYTRLLLGSALDLDRILAGQGGA